MGNIHVSTKSIFEKKNLESMYKTCEEKILRVQVSKLMKYSCFYAYIKVQNFCGIIDVFEKKILFLIIKIKKKIGFFW